MLGNRTDKDDEQEGSRQFYLSLPYNDPRRKALRGSEARLGAMYLAEADARDAAGGLIGGSLGGFLGLVGAAAGVALAISGGAIPGLIIGAIVGAIVGTILGAAIDARLRYLTPREWNAAFAVFGPSLPPRDRIILTDIIGQGGREFTVPASGLAAVDAVLNPAFLVNLARNDDLFKGRILVNMGRGFEDPLSYTRGAYGVPGQVLMHELTHAWQIHHSGSIPTILCNGIYNQVSNTLGASVYGVTDVKQWRDYNAEQQGAIVDVWFAKGMTDYHQYYRYIKANILTGSNQANSVPVPPIVSKAATVISGAYVPVRPPATTTTAVSRIGGRIP